MKRVAKYDVHRPVNLLPQSGMVGCIYEDICKRKSALHVLPIIFSLFGFGLIATDKCLRLAKEFI